MAYSSMTTNGYITAPSEIAVEKINDYVGSNSSQSNVINTEIRSLSGTIAKYPNNMIGVAAQVQDDLQALLGAYLSSLTVEVRAEAIVNNSVETNVFELKIDVSFSNGNGLSNLKKAITVNSNRLSKAITTQVKIDE